LKNETTRGQTVSTIHRSRPPADQSGKRAASRTGKSPDTPDILAASSQGCFARVGKGVTMMLRANCCCGIEAKKEATPGSDGGPTELRPASATEINLTYAAGAYNSYFSRL